MPLQCFGIAFVGVLLLGGLGGFSLSRTVGRRIASIAETAEAIIDGDMASRVPVQGSEDELDRLAFTLNRMLDRIAGLMDSLRQVSTDIAHDLRTPLRSLDGFGRLLQEDYGDRLDAQGTDYIERILAATAAF